MDEELQTPERPKARERRLRREHRAHKADDLLTYATWISLALLMVLGVALAVAALYARRFP
jgi:hypothetical protein